MRTRLAALVIWAAIAIAIAGCGGQSAALPTIAPTPCGGSHEWPPAGYVAASSAISVERLSATAVRLDNATATSWSYAVTTWFDGACTGWVAAQPEVRGTVASGTSIDVEVADPNTGLPYRIGIELWDHPCNEACTDAPNGFAWVPGTDPTLQP